MFQLTEQIQLYIDPSIDQLTSAHVRSALFSWQRLQEDEDEDLIESMQSESSFIIQRATPLTALVAKAVVIFCREHKNQAL